MHLGRVHFGVLGVCVLGLWVFIAPGAAVVKLIIGMKVSTTDEYCLKAMRGSWVFRVKGYSQMLHTILCMPWTDAMG